MRGLLLLPLLLAMPATAAEPPRLAVDDAGLVLTGLPGILAEEEVKEHLTTGLTTSFHFRLSGRLAAGGKLEGGARVVVRYELWDEVFHVAAQGIDGDARRRTLASFDELLAWWQDLRLVVHDGAPRAADRLRLVVDVVPFSQSETDDARRWLSDTMSRSGTEEVGRSTQKRSETLRRTMSLLLATSIQRRPLISYRFDLQPPGGTP